MFLSDDEIKDLTGYKRPADQRRWLMQKGYRFDVNGLGRPKVSRSHVEERLGGRIDRPREPKLNLK